MSVSRLVLGTVALGIPYGLSGGSAAMGGADEATATAILRRALTSGIDVFDTAPSYGDAERRVGAVLGSRGRVWTKLSNLTVDEHLTSAASQSLDRSLVHLRRDRVQLLQWHNWRAELAADRSFRACWDVLARDERVEALGASTYGIDDARAAVRSGLFQTVQVEWNLLNQRVLDEIGDAAAAAGIAIAVRSVFLQGVLTRKGATLPAHLRDLAAPRARAEQAAESLGIPLNALALRAALGHPARPLVIVGPDREEQLAEIVEHARMGPLDAAVVRDLASLDIGLEPIADPRTWRVSVT